MALNSFANLARTVLDNAGLPAGTGVGGTFGVAAGTGAGPTTQHPVFVENEEVIVTRAGDVYTVVARLAPVNHGAGATMIHDVSSRDLNALMAMLPKPAVGDLLTAHGATAAAASVMAEGFMVASRFVIPQRLKVDALAVGVTGLGTAGAVVRMGIYADLDGKPVSAAPLVDAGTVTATIAGDRVIVLGAPLTLEPGVVWGVTVCQGGAVTRPTVAHHNVPSSGRTTSISGALNSTMVWTVAGVAGALPAGPAWGQFGVPTAVLGFRISALNT